MNGMQKSKGNVMGPKRYESVNQRKPPPISRQSHTPPISVNCRFA